MVDQVPDSGSGSAPDPAAESVSPAEVERLHREFHDQFERLRGQIARVIVGQDEVIEQLLIAIFSRGHCILEGVPGLAKTLLVSTLSSCLDLEFRRIQFTPDLMPADITGTEVIQEDRATGTRSFRFLKGPVFANVILADEINRTPPKTQAALLESMQERQVTVGGERYPLPEPFFVLATQNPIEQEGTYPLPEAQQDRFMFKVFVRYPAWDEEKEIIRRTTSDLETRIEPVLNADDIRRIQKTARQIPVAEPIVDYALKLVRQTRRAGGQEPPPEFVADAVAWGAGPRACQFLILGAKTRALLTGRYHVSVEDVQSVAHPVLRHRILPNFQAEARGVGPDAIIDRLIETTPTEQGALGADGELRRYFDPKTLARIGRLELRVRTVVEGFISGLHRSPYHGQSVEFVDHREYVQGDDPRHIDWKVLGRADRVVIKRYEEDTNLRGHILLDVSESMRFQHGDLLSKFDYGATLGACIAYLLSRQHDAIGLTLFDSEVRDRIPLSTHPSTIHRLAAAMDRAEPREKTGLGAVLSRVASETPRRGLVVLISDLFAPLDEIASGLRELAVRRQELIVFQLLDEAELEFPFEGNTLFRGLEQYPELMVEPRTLRDAYLEALHRFLDAVRQTCAGLGVDYRLVSTAEPLDVPIIATVSARSRVRRRYR